MFLFRQGIWVTDCVSPEDQEATVLPEMWEAMQTQQLKVVELKPETKDYREAAERFLMTTRLLKHEKVKVWYRF